MRNDAFSKKQYRNLLETALESGYSIAPFKLLHANPVPRGRTIILRHDIDVSLSCALDMAVVEHKKGITATYFILLYGDFYNPLSRKGRTIIQRIDSLGHEIGLHWDARDYTPSTWKRKFTQSVQILSDVVGNKVVSSSQHEPTITGMYPFGEPKSIYDAYSSRYNKFQYISDSPMRWREKTPYDLIHELRNIQLLIHPFWWMLPGKTQKAKLQALSKERTGKIEKLYTSYYLFTMKALAHRRARDKKTIRKKP